MRYVVARHNDNMREMTYRIFISDTAYLINENIAKISGGSRMRYRYSEIIHPQKEETRTSEEIIKGLKEKLQEI